MNIRLLIASFIAAATTTIHIFLGGADVATPLLHSTLPEEPRMTLFVAWQMTSIALGFSAIALFIGSLPRHQQAARYMVIFVSLLWLGFAAAFLAVGLSQPAGGLFTLPQWTLLTPVGLLGLWGANLPRRNSSDR